MHVEVPHVQLTFTSYGQTMKTKHREIFDTRLTISGVFQSFAKFKGSFNESYNFRKIIDYIFLIKDIDAFARV